MLDLDENEYRHVFAELTALRFLASAAWETIIADWPEADRRGALDDLLRMGTNVSHPAARRSEAEAEAAADIAVLARDRLVSILERVARRTTTDWSPPADDPFSGLLRRPKSALD